MKRLPRATADHVVSAHHDKRVAIQEPGRQHLVHRKLTGRGQGAKRLVTEVALGETFLPDWHLAYAYFEQTRSHPFLDLPGVLGLKRDCEVWAASAEFCNLRR